MRSLRIGARIAPFAAALAAMAAPAQQLHPTYFGRPGEMPTAPAYKYQHPWTNSIFGYRTCRTEADEAARYERARMVAMGQHIAAYNRLPAPPQPGHDRGEPALSYVNGNYGQGFGATAQQECTEATLQGAACLVKKLPHMAKAAAGSVVHEAGRAWQQGQLVGCAFEGNHYGVCNSAWQNGGAGFKSLVAFPGNVAAGLKSGLGEGLGHAKGCKSCGGHGCSACGGGQAFTSRAGGCKSCGGKGCATCGGGHAGRGGCSACGGKGCGACRGLGMPGHGAGGAFGGPMPPYYSAYPGMNREDALRYVEGFQYYPPNQIIRSPRDFFMFGERYGIGK